MGSCTEFLRVESKAVVTVKQASCQHIKRFIVLMTWTSLAGLKTEKADTPSACELDHRAEATGLMAPV